MANFVYLCKLRGNCWYLPLCIRSQDCRSAGCLIRSTNPSPIELPPCFIDATWLANCPPIWLNSEEPAPLPSRAPVGGTLKSALLNMLLPACLAVLVTLMQDHTSIRSTHYIRLCSIPLHHGFAVDAQPCGDIVKAPQGHYAKSSPNHEETFRRTKDVAILSEPGHIVCVANRVHRMGRNLFRSPI
jgi:hypothetical protein